MMQTSVILPAAGVGRRFTSGDVLAGTPSKVELDIAGKPAFLHAIDAFSGRGDVLEIIVAVRPERLEAFEMTWGDRLSFEGVRIVAGGEKERWQTVMLALDAVSSGATHVAVHDAARPLVSKAMIDRVMQAAEEGYDAVIPALPVSSTLKRVAVAPAAHPAAVDDPADAILGSPPTQTEAYRIEQTVPRSGLVAAQTPQLFEVSLIRRAYAAVASGTIDPSTLTDDAAAIEALGEAVYSVEGDPLNLKITRPADAELAAAILDRAKQRDAARHAARQLFGDDDDE